MVHKNDPNALNETKSISYRDAGVNIDAGNAFVDEIKEITKRTLRPEVLSNLGGFGALCGIPSKYKNPVIVSATDGVGTKLKLAVQLKKHDTIGIDLVAMCVNDLIVCGAEPLFFLDYYATGGLNIITAKSVVSGIGAGCEAAGCALIGGETAEMPGIYTGEDYDLAGFAVGVVEKTEIIDQSKVKTGDIIIGLKSSGPHSNGYSLIRKIIEVTNTDLTSVFQNSTLGEALLTPTTIYVKRIREVSANVPINSLAHITGGGLLENIPRALPPNAQARINISSWERPAIFNWLQETGNVEESEMHRTFNCGIGMAICIDKKNVEKALTLLNKDNESAMVIGDIVQRPKNEETVLLTA